MSERNYAPRPGFSPVWRNWGGEQALFDCDSGATYLFDEITATVLKELQAGPLAVDALVERVAGALLFFADDEFAKHIDTVLAELSHKKLIVSSSE